MYEVSLTILLLLLLWFSGVSCQPSHKCYIEWDSFCVPIFVYDSHQLPYELVECLIYYIKKNVQQSIIIYHYKERKLRKTIYT